MIKQTRMGDIRHRVHLERLATINLPFPRTVRRGVPILSNPTSTVIVGRKLQSLDGLRAIAIILVFCNHAKDLCPPINLITNYVSHSVGLGWMGVDLFFVLSGFLITGILLDTRDASNYFSGFYARRVLRIFPLYYLVLIAVIVAGSLLNSPKVASVLPAAEDRWFYFCYLTNWIGLWRGRAGMGSGYLIHFWSLAVEEQFYLFWPLVVWLVRPRAIPWVAGAVAVFATVFRFAWAVQGGHEKTVIAWATLLRPDALFVGAICAYLFRYPARVSVFRKWLPWIATLGVGSSFLALSGMFFFPVQAGRLLFGSSPAHHNLDEAIPFYMDCGGYTLLALGFGALVLLAAHTEGESSWMQKFLSSRALAPIGKYSYGIYVFHYPILGAATIYAVPRLIVHSVGEAIITPLALVIVVATVTFAISALSYEFFEKRILRLRRYFEAQYALVPDEEILCDGAVVTETAGD
ncbi:MAG: acyltransferase [Terriglobales bacterium]